MQEKVDFQINLIRRYIVQKDVTEKFMAYFRVAILVLVLVANAIFHLVDFEYGWLIFIGNIFFFTLPGNDFKEKLATVTLGGLVGIILAYLLIIGIVKLTPLIGGFLGYMIPLAIAISILIILHPRAPKVLNNVGFAYLICCTMNAEKFAANFMTHLLVFLVGSFIFNGVCLLMINPCMKLALFHPSPFHLFSTCILFLPFSFSFFHFYSKYVDSF